MKEQKQEEIQYESTLSGMEEDSFEDSSDEETSGDTAEEESSIKVMGVRFLPQQQKHQGGLEEVGEQSMPEAKKEEMVNNMLSPTLTLEEKEEYKDMLLGFPHLFVKDYVDVRRVDANQHHIILKPEVTPRVQKLRRLGTIKEQALLKEVRKLLTFGFIYPVENAKWVSPVVVTPKKNGK